MFKTVLIVIFCASQSAAEVVVSTRVIRPNTIVAADAVTLKPTAIIGTYTDLSQVIGHEAKVALYPGRPIRIGDIGAPALIERNQIIRLTYVRNGLQISVDARSLARAGAGERIRVMNLSSRSTVTALVLPDGSVHVTQ